MQVSHLIYRYQDTLPDSYITIYQLYMPLVMGEQDTS